MKDKKYKVILCDPPWMYSNRGVNGAAEKHYPTMTPTQIKILPIDKVIDENCILVLWSTNPMLNVAIDVIDAWGFSFVTAFPWIKFTGDGTIDEEGNFNKNLSWGTGFWVRGCSEQVLIARRGNVRFPDRDFLGILSDRLKHSKKPDTIYDYCEVFEGPYLELFARQKRDGWDVWGGDEVINDVELLDKIEDKEMDSEFVDEVKREIREAWNWGQRAKWTIGDAAAKLIRSGMYKSDSEALRVVLTMTPGLANIEWLRMLYKVSITFPKRERKLYERAWSSYYKEYLEISEEAQKRAAREKRIAYEIWRDFQERLDLGSE